MPVMLHGHLYIAFAFAPGIIPCPNCKYLEKFYQSQNVIKFIILNVYNMEFSTVSTELSTFLSFTAILNVERRMENVLTAL